MHPFFIGVTELTYQPKQKVVQGSTKLFLDDVMKDIKQEGLGVFNPADKGEKQTQLLFSYLSKHLKIRSAPTIAQIKQQSYFSIVPVGWEVEEDAIWIYYQLKCKSFQCVEIYNNLLFASCPQQVHIYKLTQGNQKINDRTLSPTTTWQGCF